MPLLSLVFSIISSNGSLSSLFSGFIPSTTPPYICMNLRYESHANLLLPDFLAIPSTASSFKPRFKTVSIIPGIETRAPERTETKHGFSLSPNLVSVRFSTNSIAFSTSSLKRLIIASFPSVLYSALTSVVMVKPGGTGTPIKFISARFAPFPPSRLFISALPSAIPFPKV